MSAADENCTIVLASAVEASRFLIEAHAHELLIDVHPTVPIVIDGDSIVWPKSFPTSCRTARSIRTGEPHGG
jgi:hypothetical protein